MLSFFAPSRAHFDRELLHHREILTLHDFRHFDVPYKLNIRNMCDESICDNMDPLDMCYFIQMENDWSAKSVSIGIFSCLNIITRLSRNCFVESWVILLY